MGKNSDTKDRYKRQDVCGHRYPFFFFFQIRYPVAHVLTGLGGQTLDG